MAPSAPTRATVQGESVSESPARKIAAGAIVNAEVKKIPTMKLSTIFPVSLDARSRESAPDEIRSHAKNTLMLRLIRSSLKFLRAMARDVTKDSIPLDKHSQQSCQKL